MSRRTGRVFWVIGGVLELVGTAAGGDMVVAGGLEAWWRREARSRGRFRAGTIAAGAAGGRRCRSGGQRGRSEPACGAVGILERGCGRQAGGQAQDDLAGVVDYASGDAEQHSARELGLAAARQVPWG